MCRDQRSPLQADCFLCTMCCSPHHLSIAQWAGAWLLVMALGWGSWRKEGFWAGVREFIAALLGSPWRWSGWSESSGWPGWWSRGTAGRAAPSVGCGLVSVESVRQCPGDCVSCVLWTRGELLGGGSLLVLVVLGGGSLLVLVALGGAPRGVLVWV